MDARTMVIFFCALAFLGAVGAADLLPCDFFNIPKGYLEASGGPNGNIKCTKWNSLTDAKNECLSTRGCDGFSFGKSGDIYGGCLKKNRDAGYNGNEKYAGYHKNIMGCRDEDEYDLRGDGQCGNRGDTVEKLVSHNKPAQQSSILHEGWAERAVDGNQNTTYDAWSCTHTRHHRNPWWQLDLEATFDVTRIVITNRGDCCGERLSNFEIRVGDEINFNGNPTCVSGEKVGEGETTQFFCGSKGRYVTVRIVGFQILTLCEVQVFAKVPAGA